MKLQLLASRARSGNRLPRADEIDRHVATRLRQQRIMNGLSVCALADLIGVSYQQAHKYERGVNRIAADRLYVIAQVLGVDVRYFFEGLEDDSPSEWTRQQRIFLELGRNFRSIHVRKHQQTICMLTRILADLENACVPDTWELDRNTGTGRKRLAIAD